MKKGTEITAMESKFSVAYRKLYANLIKTGTQPQLLPYSAGNYFNKVDIGGTGMTITQSDIFSGICPLFDTIDSYGLI